MTYAEIIRLYEKKDHIIKKTHMTDEQKAEVIDFFTKHREQENQISGDEWNKPELLTYERFKQVIDAFNNRNTKSRANKIANKIGIAGLTEGKDYVDWGEFEDTLLGTFHAYTPLSHLGAKTIAGKTVKPYPKDAKDSASWCIGQTGDSQYWNTYFFNQDSDFIVVCGDKIPTKKVCFEILKNYDTSTAYSELKNNENYYNKESLVNNIKVWDYYDNDHSLDEVLERIFDKVKGKSYQDLLTLGDTFTNLIAKAKVVSDKSRIDQLEELKKPIVLTAEEYNNKLNDLRKTDEYNTHLNEGINILRFLDNLTKIFHKFEPEIKYSTINPRTAELLVVDSLISWFSDNRNKRISDINDIPRFLYPDIRFSNLRYGVPVYNTDNEDASTITLSTEINTPFMIEEYKYYHDYIFFRLKEFSGVNGVYKNVIADFNEWEYLTVDDLVVFFGQAVSEPQDYKGDSIAVASSLQFKNTKVFYDLGFLAHGSKISINETTFPKIAKTLNWKGTYEEFYSLFFDFVRQNIDIDYFNVQQVYKFNIFLIPESLKNLKLIDTLFSMLIPLTELRND